MKLINKIITAIVIVTILSVTLVACSSSKEVYNKVTKNVEFEKSGAQLWGETCNRCHLAPSPSAYNDTDWETISLHMRVRANLTEKEITKITNFLKSAN